MASKKNWADLSPTQKRSIYVAGAAEVLITAVALRDLARRPRREIRGPKAAWVVSFFVQPFGPLAYFAAGRRD